jgi:hypothetical protein
VAGPAALRKDRLDVAREADELRAVAARVAHARVQIAGIRITSIRLTGI